MANETSKVVTSDAYNPGNGLWVTSGFPFRDDLVHAHKGVDWGIQYSIGLSKTVG